MSDVFSLSGKNIHASARAAVMDGLIQLAEHKNVPVNPHLREALAKDVLQRMDIASLCRIANEEEQGLTAMVREVDAQLDATVLARMWHLIALFEGKKDFNDPSVRATARVIMDKYIETLPKPGVACWPDPMQLVADHYATVPRGPITVTLEDGSELTTYLLGWKPHRNPEEGPAVHWAHGDKHKWEYRVEGELHRPHQDGPAMMCTHYLDSCGQPCGICGEEYYEHGKHHRPPELGPALKQWGEAGDPVAEAYYENGELHRDPSLGPAWWLVRDARVDPKAGRPRTEIKYYTRGKLHRDQEDGPAVIIRDNETGTIVEQQYWRDGKRHRHGAPARIRRDETGKVTLEGWYVDGRLHRDHCDGPALMDTEFDGLEIYCEEYHEDGKWHRPSSAGPAVLNTDRAGEVLREFYIEHGQLHRDPKEGPAWRHIHDVRTDRNAAQPFTELRYCVRGQLHREEGPAWIKRDNETGVLVVEEYWRNGFYWREGGGPVSIERTPEGVVIFEYCPRDDGDVGEKPTHISRDEKGRLREEKWFTHLGEYRDAAEGPGCISRDPETGRTREEFYVNGELRPGSLGAAVITRDGKGTILWEEFWDGKAMDIRYPKPAAGEASPHG